MKMSVYILGFVVLMTATAEAQTIRLLTYNIHHARNESGVVDIDGLAAYIDSLHPDVVALQEVDSVCRRSGNMDIAAELGKRTGMYYYFGKAMEYDGGGYGEALLSRLPIENIRTIRLPVLNDKDREPRAAIEAGIRLPGGLIIGFVATHLDHVEDEADRLLQARFLAERLRYQNIPYIIAGDLNALPQSQTMKALFEVAAQPPLDKNLPTWPSGTATKKIDYFLLSKNYQWQCTRFEVPEEKHISDHRPVLMEIKIPVK